MLQPIQFEQLVQKVIQIVRDSVLVSEMREISFLENPTAKRELDKQVENLLLAFHDVLKNLAFKDDLEDGEHNTAAMSQLLRSAASPYTHHTTRHVPLWEQRLLTTLSNCQYTSTKVLNDVIELFSKSGCSIPKMPVDNVKLKFDTLEKLILETYLEQKSDPLVGTIEPSMYLGLFDWDTKITPVDIRPYAKECINNLIQVLSEVNINNKSNNFFFYKSCYYYHCRLIVYHQL